jgi:predicted O-methyltransferase YrrM
VVARNLLEQYPEAAGMVVAMGDVTYRVSNMDPFELYCLTAICRVREPKTIFEFGTYDGATTRWLAKTVPEAEVFTLDLPPELRGEWDQATLATGPEGSDGVGSRFRATPYAAQITQLFGDSRSFDFRDFFGRMDLVVVDADHSYECASSDTENALKMLSPRGAVVWDDYGWPGVIRAVGAAAERHGFTAAHLIPSELAVYDRATTSGN